MHVEILTTAQRAVLDRLTGLGPLAAFYLAGGTALTLRHGHRRSVDFDFFREDPFDAQGLARAVEDRVAVFERLPSGEHTLYVRLEGVTASFFRYPHALLDAPEPSAWGFGLASDRDIAAMKLEAIAGRGARKDFVDLWLLCNQGLSLESTFDLFERKFGAGRTERYHRLRALAYFDDAEKQPMPDMLLPCDWTAVKAFFAEESTRLLRAGLAGP
jgi:hypothetical protein